MRNLTAMVVLLLACVACASTSDRVSVSDATVGTTAEPTSTVLATLPARQEPPPTPTFVPTSAPEPAPAIPTPNPTPQAVPTPQPVPTPQTVTFDDDWWTQRYPVAGCGATFEELEDPVWSLMDGAVATGLHANAEAEVQVLVQAVSFRDIDGDLVDEVFVEIDCSGTSIDAAHWEIVMIFELAADQTTHVVRHFIAGNDATLRIGEDGALSIGTWSHRIDDQYLHRSWTFDEVGELQVATTNISVDEIRADATDALDVLSAEGIGDAYFGADRESALAMLASLFGTPTFVSDDYKCGGSPGSYTFAEWHGDLTAFFVDGTFQGWSYSTRQYGLSPDWMAGNGYATPPDPSATPHVRLATDAGIGLLATVQELGDLPVEQWAYPGSTDPSYWPWTVSWELAATSGRPIIGVLDRSGGRTVGLSAGYGCGARWHPLPP